MAVEPRPILDPEAIAADLREAVAYAAPAGLLQDVKVVEALHAADLELARGASIDGKALALALGPVMAAISPVTLADLRGGRNPHSASNQIRAQRQQLFLTAFGLILMLCIASTMLMVKSQQTALAHLDNVRIADFKSKVTALRRMVQREGDKVLTGPLAEQYHERVAEVRRISQEAGVAVGLATEALQFPWDPITDRIKALFVKSPTAAGSDAIGSSDARPQDNYLDGICSGSALAGLPPPGAVHVEEPLRIVRNDTNFDYCFIRHLLPMAGNDTTLQTVQMAVQIRQHLVSEVEWVLPFLFGLLGSVIHLMRAVGSARIAALPTLAIATRIALGGIGGVAIGWFAGGTQASTIQSVSTISLPFMLAFIIGYGIEALFSLLDRVNARVGSIASGAPPRSTG